MIRIFDIICSFIGLTVMSPLFLILTVIGFLDTGSAFFIQNRMGLGKQTFKLIKFRSMHRDAKSVATHLADSTAITKYGKILRSSKLDELPQLWNVLIGDMSFVGPRPNLLNQSELIAVRDALGIYNFKPGITGLAQIKKIDMSTPKLLAETDAILVSNLTFKMYLYYMIVTILGRGYGDSIKF